MFSVIFLIGDERYLKEKTLSDLRRSISGPSSGGGDYKVLYGAGTSAEEISNCVSTFPFLSPKRLVVIKDFEKLSKEDTRRVFDYINNPNQHTCLVIDTDDADIMKKMPSFGSHVKVLKFSHPSGSQLSSWIASYLVSRGKKIEEDAIEMLKELSPPDLLSISQELEKLATFTLGRKTITAKDVESLTGKNSAVSAFDIAGAVGNRDAYGAMKIIRELMTAGKRSHEIIGLLAWHFKTMARVKELALEKETEYAVSQRLKMSKRRAAEFLGQAAAYSLERIQECLDILLDADMGIKRTRFNPSLILEFAVMRLCLR